MTGFNDGLGMAESYYAATAHPAPQTCRLTGLMTADVVVVGGGCTGLATALAASRNGSSVIVLEGGALGWGASGRNGGQMIPGLRLGAVDLVRRFGKAKAKALFQLAISARDSVVDLVQREQLDCDMRLTGHLSAAIKPADVADMKAEADCLAGVMDYPHARLLDAEQMEDEVGRPYAGGLLDLAGGHLHPLNYTLGLAAAAGRAGVQLFTESPALSLDRTGRGVIVRTPEGEVRAEHCVLAGDALLGAIDRSIAKHIMPIANYIAATRPLDTPGDILRHNRAVSDSRFVVNYYRLSGDGRLIFGGGERYSSRPPADMAAFVRPFIERTFPQLKGVEIDYAWGGLVSVTRTRLPHIGRDGPIYWAHGYSGMGTILSTLSGQLIAEAIRGESSGLDLFASITPPAFPGGVALRRPLHTLAMLWYAGRDRLAGRT